MRRLEMIRSQDKYSSLTSAGMDVVRRLAEENGVEIEEESDTRVRLSGDDRGALKRTK